MIPTEFGAILNQRVRRAMVHLDTVERELIAEHAKAGTVRYPSGFSNKVTRRQLSAFLAIASSRTERAAAQQLGLSQPAMTQALRDLEPLARELLFIPSSPAMI